MRVRDIGEFGLIERIARKTKADRSIIQGIGDDAAVISFSRDKYLLLASDMLVENIHFRTDTATPGEIGHKALAVNISDIAAMGGVPRYALVSAGIPPDTPLKFIDALYGGIRSLARKFKVNVVGGDTTSSAKLVINVALTGEVKKKYLTLRRGAKVGDAIMVTGTLGGSRLGRHLDFTPRLKEAQLLVKSFKLNSMIDISDGLSSDLNQIARPSKVGAVVYEELIPLSHLAASLSSALKEGEDFELLFTLPMAEARRLISQPPRGFKVTQIGEIIEKKEGVKLINRLGRVYPLAPEGFRHF